MPHETIHSTSDPVDVTVAWGRDCGYIQVASIAASTDTTAQPTKRLIGIVNGWLAEADLPQIDLAELLAKLPHANFNGWYATLDDRGRINDLIRLLQRARDGAFGRDA